MFKCYVSILDSSTEQWVLRSRKKLSFLKFWKYFFKRRLEILLYDPRLNYICDKKTWMEQLIQFFVFDRLKRIELFYNCVDTLYLLGENTAINNVLIWWIIEINWMHYFLLVSLKQTFQSENWNYLYRKEINFLRFRLNRFFVHWIATHPLLICTYKRDRIGLY